MPRTLVRWSARPIQPFDAHVGCAHGSDPASTADASPVPKRISAIGRGLKVVTTTSPTSPSAPDRRCPAARSRRSPLVDSHAPDRLGPVGDGADIAVP